jgi:RimJ/RimL family protein N-acetyltransferase
MEFQNVDNYFWQGQKVRLRPRLASDWETIFQESTDSEGMRFLDCSLELPLSVEMAQTSAENTANFKAGTIFAIETLSNELVGGIFIHSQNEKDGTFSFSVWISRHQRRKGYAKEALQIVLKYMFHELRYQKCNSACLEGNETSIKLHEQLGFKKEGQRRRNRFTNGRFYDEVLFDEVLFGLTCEEFGEQIPPNTV